jgi:hypothetical protein
MTEPTASDRAPVSATSDVQLRAARVAALLVTLGALGEIGVGVLITTLPAAAVRLLLSATVAGAGLVIARMTGIALVALGLTWWFARDRHDAGWLHRIAAGFLVYNVGVGLLFLAYMWSAGRVLGVPLLIAVLHLWIAAAFVLARKRAGRSA